MSTKPASPAIVDRTVHVFRPSLTDSPMYLVTIQNPESEMCDRPSAPKPIAIWMRTIWIAEYPPVATASASSPPVVRIATVADPWEARSASEMTKAVTMIGMWMPTSAPARALPMPLATSTPAKTPPAPVTNTIVATSGRAESRTFPRRSRLQRCWRPMMT